MSPVRVKSARQLTRGDDVKKTLQLEFDISVSCNGVLCLLLFYFMFNILNRIVVIDLYNCVG